MPLVFSLKRSTSIPLEVDTLGLQLVRSLSPEEAGRIPVQYGNKAIPAAEFFEVTGSAADDNEQVWEGDCSKVKLIGCKLADGRVTVRGNAGMHLGAEMTGGEVVVEGDAADWVGAEMHGGRIHIHGDAGHLVGAVYRGGRRGMTGGEIFIHGNAGNEVGHTMRRGLIAVAGAVGDATGFNMIAGSVFTFGEVGIRPGAGMRRGTLAFLGANSPPDMLPTFRHACTYRPTFLRVYLLHLQRVGFPVPQGIVESEVKRYLGDYIEYGKGEILISGQG